MVCSNSQKSTIKIKRESKWILNFHVQFLQLCLCSKKDSILKKSFINDWTLSVQITNMILIFNSNISVNGNSFLYSIVNTYSLNHDGYIYSINFHLLFIIINILMKENNFFCPLKTNFYVIT